MWDERLNVGLILQVEEELPRLYVHVDAKRLEAFSWLDADEVREALESYAEDISQCAWDDLDGLFHSLYCWFILGGERGGVIPTRGIESLVTWIFSDWGTDT